MSDPIEYVKLDAMDWTKHAFDHHFRSEKPINTRSIELIRQKELPGYITFCQRGKWVEQGWEFRFKLVYKVTSRFTVERFGTVILENMFMGTFEFNSPKYSNPRRMNANVNYYLTSDEVADIMACMLINEI